MKNLILISCIFMLFSCSYFSKKDKNKSKDILSDYQEYDLYDYKDHINYFKKSYLGASDIKELTINKIDQKYLNSVVDKLYKKNELFFDNIEMPKFYLIKDKRPFHFSLPNKSIFFSTGLISKYIKSEKLLYCLITYELIRSEKDIYRKIRIIPTGSMGTQRILSLLRINTETKVEVHKWSYYILKRVGIDTDNYLSWLQLQNRNSIDFSMQLGELGSISREEALFKSFVIKNSQRKRTTKKYERSSKGFYKFINKIKG